MKILVDPEIYKLAETLIRSYIEDEDHPDLAEDAEEYTEKLAQALQTTYEDYIENLP